MQIASGTPNSVVGFEVPILLLGFNRPEECQRVIASLREVRAKNVYFSVDGPRPNSQADITKVETVKALKELFDWGCELHVRFLDENLGCKLAISSGISWFFENVEEGIILEDDCLPNKDFFYFCKRMLEKYRYTENIMHISGTSYLPSNRNYKTNHYFSALHEVWGWATWKRAWNYFEINIQYSDKKSEFQLLHDYFRSSKVAKWFQRYLEDSKSPTCSLWSTYWSYSLIIRNAVSVAPIVNLVSNIGFDRMATHGTSKSFQLYNHFPAESLPNLPDPQKIEVSRSLDEIRFRLIRKTDPSLRYFGKARSKIRRAPNKILRVLNRKPNKSQPLHI